MYSARRSFLALLGTLAALLHAAAAVVAQGAFIEGISPPAARPGERVTITGSGFGAINVRITVNGVPAAVLEANGNRVTFVVPAGVAAGDGIVRATNPGGLSASIGFSVPPGALLIGSPSTPIRQALFDLPPVPVDYDDIENDLIMTRLSARLAAEATVGQVNAAMSAIAGGIVTMHPATLNVSVAVPRQDSVEGLRHLVQTLSAQPGILGAWLALEVQPRFARFPVTPDVLDRQRFLLHSRFPAAWNTVALVVERDQNGQLTCKHPRIPMLVADFFGSEPDGFATHFPTLRRPSSPPLGLPAARGQHGYLTTLAAAGPFGANPFAECLDVRLLQAAGFNPSQDLLSVARNMPSGRFIVNYSMGFMDRCAGAACEPPDDRLVPAYARAYESLEWKELTRSRWDDFLLAVSAGNERNDPSAVIWNGAAEARVGSAMGVAVLDDPLLSFASSDALWTPSAEAAAQGFTTLAASPGTQAQIGEAVRAADLDDPDDVASNVVIVGSSTNTVDGSAATSFTPPELLNESPFSDRGSDVRAVGEEIFGMPDVNGTSFAAPQVAGLASYLWLVSPELRNTHPPQTTRQAIVANARNGTIDAYAAVLSLDEASLPTPATAPVRLSILDLDVDGGFTESDVDLFLRALYFVDPQTGEITGAPPADNTVTLQAFDLNGDGFSTSGSRRERFDLDRVGSTRFGATAYGSVTQSIQGQNVQFDELALTDVEILCYYAYSSMFEGDPSARDALLGGRCDLAIQPQQVTLASGAQQQFTATSPVTWTTSGGGTVSPDGVYTAGQVSGTFTVRATSTLNTALTAEATVTVVGSTASTQIAGPYDGEETRGIVGFEQSVTVGRWLLTGGAAGSQLFRAGALATCPDGNATIFFNCSPPFDISNGAFSASRGGRSVSGTVGGGRLTFVLDEQCPTNDGEIVQCRLQFDGELVTVQVSPSLLDFGTIPVGGVSAPQTITLTNSGLFPVQVFVSVPGFPITGSTCFSWFVPEGGSCTVSISFSPIAAGVFDVQAQFAAGGAAIVGTVRVRGVAQ